LSEHVEGTIVRFRAERSIGRLSVWDGSDDGWQPLAEARWDVLVPGGHRLALACYREVGDDDLVPLAEGPHVLENVVLMQSAISDSGIGHVAALPNLRLLDLFGTAVGAPGCLELAACGRLEWLSLTLCPVDDVAVRQLRDLPRLRRLSLKGTRVSDAGMRWLAELPSLEWLSVTDCNIGDAGLDTIGESSSLRTLSIAGTAITPDGVARFWQRRPDVELVRH
jgi:hypothetical protein